MLLLVRTLTSYLWWILLLVGMLILKPVVDAVAGLDADLLPVVDTVAGEDADLLPVVYVVAGEHTDTPTCSGCCCW